MKSEANLVVISCPKQLLSIFVKAPRRDILKIEVPALFTVGDVKEIIGSMIVSSVSDHCLSYAGKKLEDDSKTLACYEIKDESILEMLPPSVNQIFVKTWSGKTVTLDVQLCNTIKNVKQKLYDKLKISPHLHKIVFAGRRLSDDRNLASYGIQKDSTLLMVLTPKFKIIRMKLTDTTLKKLPDSTTISSLKDKFQQDSQRRVKEVIFCHETLMDERSLADYDIKRNSEMDFALEWP
ncbi:hypothetical protein Ddye_018892 [Dipteronia dyeriana]|uniref:Ubiquitin-like domain-containing protein n=1 Tax=Dipteronia dyeriana TaxID=168575 RepID=A0AAD9WV80_9ROSI|nr:hypothetical protein Ddye_018892 [Dipteronia dyeriana]